MKTENKEELVSHCCSGKVYAPTDDWAMCSVCNNHCDIVETE